MGLTFLRIGVTYPLAGAVLGLIMGMTQKFAANVLVNVKPAQA